MWINSSVSAAKLANMQILVTGAAGFIGADLSQKLLSQGHSVVGLDNFNDYYDVSLKEARIKQVQQHAQASNFRVERLNIENREDMAALFEENKFDVVVNLAAQAGVRYSIENPQSYIDSNLVGFGNILEGCRQSKVGHLVYASSSSVYGANKNFPFRRPDMAPFRFASRMLKGEPIPVYNNGNMIRDFTYIDDITEGLVRVVESSGSAENYSLYNIGRGEKVPLMEFIDCLSKYLGVEAKVNMLPMQDGDVPRTMANTEALQHDFGYQPTVSVDEGVRRFAEWYKEFYSS